MRFNDKSIMMRALALARRGGGAVSPNPMVGALVVKNGKIVGRGWHKTFGGEHAEVIALRAAGKDAIGATLFVTLEPCNHFGKTPPCTEAIIKAGIGKVVVATRDPNKAVSGGGIEHLRSKGIEVTEGVCEKEGKALLESWYYWLMHKKPLVLLKLAISLDGKLAFEGGNSKWISNSVSRGMVQRLRRNSNAVMVGAGTVIADNPFLSNRTGLGSEPIKIIIDAELSVPIDSRVFTEGRDSKADKESRCMVVTTSRSLPKKRREFEEKGIEVLVLDDEIGKVDFLSLFEILGERGVQQVLCEGGAQLASSLLTGKHCQKLLLFIAPIEIGNKGLPFLDVNASNRTVKQDYGLVTFTTVLTRGIKNDQLCVYDVK